MANQNNVTIDLTNYLPSVGDRVIPGSYQARVQAANLSKAKSGTDMITVHYEITEPGEFAGSTIVDRMTLSEKALFRVVGFLQAIGYPTPKKKIPLDLAKWKGKVLVLDLDDGEPFNNAVRSEIKGYVKMGKGQAAAPADDLEPADEEDEFEGTEDDGAEEAKAPASAKGKSNQEEIDLADLDNL